jgi:thiosulfate/3-mercaptopyruvate sulfurtransferase
MSALGVSERATIVVYEQEGVFSAPRAWWMLRTFGAESVYVLDGGLRAWIEAGLPAESGPVQRPAARFHAKLNTVAVNNFAGIQKAIAVHEQILDARSAGRFAGASPEPRAGIASGHMPGAINLPFTELAEDGRLKPAATLREIFLSKGIDIEQPVTTTCGSGVTAAVLALGLEIAGSKNVRLYDGSWAEYAQQPGAVVEKSK